MLSCVGGVNLYVLHTSLTDFHCFDFLTDVRGNLYGFTLVSGGRGDVEVSSIFARQ